MRITFVADQGGQAVVVIALAIFVLMSAIALSVDWGFSFVTRRDAQNSADAAALAAGRLLATTYVGGAVPFETTEEDAWCEAARVRDANIANAPAALTHALTLSFSSDGSTWSTITSADCSVAGSTPVPQGTALVRVVSSVTYRPLFASALRGPLVVSGSARVALASGADVRPLTIPPTNAGTPGDGLSGLSTSPNVGIWPIVERIDILAGAIACGEHCDDSSRRIVLFGNGPQAPRFGDFTGFITLSHYSTREQTVNVLAHQPITESDYTGSPNAHHGHTPLPPMPNADPRACGGAATWDTNGSANLATSASCDVPNWLRYGFRGSLSVSTNWSASGSWAGFEGAPQPMELPSPVPGTGCTPLAFLPAPSCTGGPNLLGDWVETVPGDVDDVMADQMRAFIQAYGRDAPNGRGLAAVVHLFLWDCSDQFDPSQPAGSRWTRITADCSAPAVRPDRVHLASVAPFTVYLDDIRTNGSNERVVAYFGDVFSDAGRCAAIPLPSGCDMNPATNSAYLIPDD